MIKPMWDDKAVKAYETGQGVKLVNELHPHYEPAQEPQQMTGKQPPAPWNAAQPQRTWIGLTNEELADCWDTIPERAMRRVEAKLKDKNT